VKNFYPCGAPMPEKRTRNRRKTGPRRRFCADSLVVLGKTILPRPHLAVGYSAEVDGITIISRGVLDFWCKVRDHYRMRESCNKTFHGSPKKLAAYLAAIETVQNRITQLEAAKAKAEA
jgi:hypothetical protein